MGFPLNSNDPYIKATGERSTLGAEIGSGGSSDLPEYGESDAGKVLSVDDNGDLEWKLTGVADTETDRYIVGTIGDFYYYVPMTKYYIGDDYIPGYVIKTNPNSDAYDAMVDIYTTKLHDGVSYPTFVKTVHHDPTKGDTSYSDDVISVTYNSKWIVTFTDPLYNLAGTAYTSPVQWTYSTTVDYLMLTEDPTAT